MTAQGTRVSPPPVAGSSGRGDRRARDETVACDVLDGGGPVVVADCSTVVVVVEEATAGVDVVVLVPTGTLDEVLVELGGRDDVDVVGGTVDVVATVVEVDDPGVVVDVVEDVVLVELVLVVDGGASVVVVVLEVVVVGRVQTCGSVAVAVRVPWAPFDQRAVTVSVTEVDDTGSVTVRLNVDELDAG